MKSALTALPAAVAAQLRAAIAAVAEQAAAEARRRLPNGPLADSIGVRPDPETGAAIVEATSPHAAFVEYGTVHQAARPFLRPAVAAVGDDAHARLGAAFATAVRTSLEELS